MFKKCYWDFQETTEMYSLSPSRQDLLARNHTANQPRMYI